MAERKKRILVICPYPERVAPSQRLKYEQYFESFRENNLEIHVSSFMTQAFWKVVYKKGHFFQKVLYTLIGYFRRTADLFRLPFYDLVYIHLWVTPFGPPIFERLFAALNSKIVYDIDDMIFLTEKSKSNNLISGLKGRTKPFYLMKKAKHVIVCTPVLEEVAVKFNANVTDISSTIDTTNYQPVNKYSNSSSLVIGWSGSHSTSKYLKLLEKVLVKLREKYAFRVLVIGDPGFSFQQLECEAIPWKEATEVQDLQKIDIGLYPLPLDEAWVLGKSGLKALQYMALGIPTVATAIGANFRVIDNGISGFLVKTEEEWSQCLIQLMENTTLRKEIGLMARKKVVEQYSIDANKGTYLSIIESVLSK